MTLETLLLLQKCLLAQQMTVGDPDFSEVAKAVLQAIEQLEEAITTAKKG